MILLSALLILYLAEGNISIVYCESVPKLNAAPVPIMELGLRNLKNYLLALLISIIGTLPCIALGFVVANANWFTKEGSALSVNSWNVTIFYVFATTFAIVGFCAMEYWCTWGHVKFIQHKYFVVGIIGVIFSVGPYFLFYYSNFSYWYYYIDTFTIVVIYSVTSFATGYFGSDNEIERHYKVRNGLMFFFSGMFVTAVTMIYGMFILMYYGTMSNIVKVIWRLSLHPIYFEFLVMIPSRMLVKQNIQARGSILSTLLIVHSHSHIFSLGRLMIANIDDLTLTIGSTVALNIGKLILRISLGWRDEKMEKMINWVKQKLCGVPYVPAEVDQWQADSMATIRAVVITSEVCSIVALVTYRSMLTRCCRLFWRTLPSYARQSCCTFSNNRSTSSRSRTVTKQLQSNSRSQQS